MILFYSVHCPHCSMLLDSIKRYDSEKMIKLCNVESIRKTNPKVLQQISMVPALLVFGPNNSREFLFGKDVFDYLLLPNRGRLMQPSLAQKREAPNQNQNAQSFEQQQLTLGEPLGFEIAGGAAGNFTFIEDESQVHQGRSYVWSSLEEGTSSTSAPAGVAAPTTTTMQQTAAHLSSAMQGLSVETRTKVELPSMDNILAQRDNDVAFLRPKQPTSI